MSDDGGDKKGFFTNLLEELDFKKVERESLNFKDLLKEEKKEYEKEDSNRFRGKKNNPLTGRRIIVEEGTSKSPRNNIIIILLIALVIVSLFFTFQYFNKSNINTLKSDFITSIEENNINKLYSLIYIPGDNKDHYKESLNNFIQLYNTDIEFQNYIIESIDGDLNSISEDENFETDNLIGVVKGNNKRKFLVKITPLIIMNNSIIESNIIIEENKLEIDNLSLIPGAYNIETDYEFLKLNNKENIKYVNESMEYSILFDFKNSTIGNETITLSTGDNNLVIFGPRDDAIVFLDNKNTNLTVKEFNEFGNKNILNFSTISVVEKNKFGLGISDIMNIDNNYYGIELSVNYSNDIMLDYFMNLIRITLEEESLALQNSDINFLTTIGGETLDSVVGWIKDNIGLNQFYVRYYMSLLVDRDSFSTNIKNYSQKAFLGGFLSYKEGKFSKDEEVNESKLEDYTDKKVGFNFVYNEKDDRWIVDWGTTYKNISTDNTILMKLN